MAIQKVERKPRETKKEVEKKDFKSFNVPSITVGTLDDAKSLRSYFVEIEAEDLVKFTDEKLKNVKGA
jgi:hypothetical protein